MLSQDNYRAGPRQENLCLRPHSTIEIVVVDTKEISTVALTCTSFKSHIAVHYFANGVAETDNIWPLARRSTQTIQALNYGGVFSVGPVVELPTEIHGEILARNTIGQYPNDPVCCAIYEECKAVDEEFADSSLCMTIAI